MGHPTFGQIALTAQVAALIANYRAFRNWVYAHHFNFALYTDLVKKANGGNFVACQRLRTRAWVTTPCACSDFCGCAMCPSCS